MAWNPQAEPFDEFELAGDPNMQELDTEEAPDALVTELGDNTLVDFAPEDSLPEPEFGDNLAEFIDEDELDSIATDLIDAFEQDRTSREDWEKTYIQGLDLLGLKFEERDKPWKGACGIVHPMLAESVVRFQSQTIQEIFPASGPAKAKIEGKESHARVKQAHRVVNYLNYSATTIMKEYRTETEKLLFSLPLAGSAFRKVYFDPSLGREVSMFVPAEDFIVADGATSLATCERATHIQRRTANEVRKLQVSGFYRDIDIGDPVVDKSEVQEKYEKVKGEKESERTSRHTQLEMMVDYDLVGFEDMHEDGEPTGIALPYVITIDKSSRKILSIYRNWREDDPQSNRRQHYVHYQYIPGLGFYGFGLVHIIGGLSKSATSIIRQLIDSGTLATLPGGLKMRGLRIKGDDTPIAPGEWRDVDVPGGVVADNIMPLPYKEPSGVLYQLLGDVVNEGRRFASAADVKAADMNAQAPVGTTLAILEREMKVLSAVQARIHHSMSEELSLLADIIRDFGPDEYPYELDGQFNLKEDFDERVDIIPVSDPNAGTMAQRIMQYQAALQLSATAPQMYDMPALHRQMLEVLGIQEADKIIPTDEDMSPMDPVSENMAILNGKPVKAFQYQDHEAHIQVHMSMAQNPQIMQLLQQNPKAQAIQAAGMDHVTEHIAMAYRQKIEQELGVPMPKEGEPLTDDVEYRLSQLVAPAAAQLTGKAQKQAQAEKNAKEQQDPIIQMRQEELRQKGEDLRKKAELAERKQAMAEQKAMDDAEFKREQLESDERKEAARITGQLEQAVIRAKSESERQEAKANLDAFKMGYESIINAIDEEMRDANVGQENRRN